MSAPGPASGASVAAGTVAGASLADLAGENVVVAYSSTASEYAALHAHSVVVDRSHRHRLRLAGPSAPEVLTGLVTNDVLALEAGQGLYAAALTPKGKILADLRVFRDAESLLVDAPRLAAEGWMTAVKKYVNPRLARYVDVSAELRDLGIFGPQARHVVEQLTGANATALGILPPYSHATVLLDGHAEAPVLVARVPDLGVEGFELFVSPSAFTPLWERAVAAGAVPMGLAAWEIARIEAGRPEWGLDMDESTIPQEANFDDLHAISYTKGCYVGQEVVARVHFRGHVNRHLRGLRAAGTDAPPHGATLLDSDGRTVGNVRSTATSPARGGIALAMVRREVTPGASLVASWESDGVTRELSVEVLPLPFPE